MADFYKIHERAIEQAWYRSGARHVGEHFRIIVEEPLAPVSDSALAFGAVATIITFRMLPKNQFEPASIGDREAIKQWKEKYKDYHEDSWKLPVCWRV